MTQNQQIDPGTLKRRLECCHAAHLHDPQPRIQQQARSGLQERCVKTVAKSHRRYLHRTPHTFPVRKNYVHYPTFLLPGSAHSARIALVLPTLARSESAATRATEGITLQTHKNTILSRISPDALKRLQLQPITFEVGHEIEFPGKAIRRLYFLEEGMASMTNTFKDGSQVEVGMFGYESVIGVSALMGTIRSLNRVYTQIEGRGFYCSLTVASAEFARADRFQQLCLRYVQAQLVQAAQSAGCNAKHHLEQRLARWLLIAADRAHKPQFHMPQEFIADMVGTTRSAVSRAASILKDEGLIEYTRGAVHIMDVERLEHRACECYGVIKHHLDNFSEFEEDSLR